jgi:hypothetical protein
MKRVKQRSGWYEADKFDQDKSKAVSAALVWGGGHDYVDLITIQV